MKYVLVQHSGYGYGSKPDFMWGLEQRSVDDKQQANIAEHAVPVYDDYNAASEAAHAFMYPEGYEGMVPVANRAGKFLQAKIDGLKLFKPTPPAPAAA